MSFAIFLSFVCVYPCTLLYSWVLLDASGSSCIFPAMALGSFFQEAVAPFIREWYFEAKIWMLGVLVATGVSLLLGTLSGQRARKDMYVY